MRELGDMLESVTGTVRFVIAALVLGGVVIAITMIAGISFVAPQVADNVGERAERFGDRAIEAAHEKARRRDLADDGWGDAKLRADEGGSRESDGDPVGGWGH